MTTCIAILSGYQKPRHLNFQDVGITHDMQVKFINFMIHDSPWKGCFLNPNAQDVMDKKSWVLSTEMGANLLASAAFATRLVSEWPNKFHAWDKLTNLGVDGAEAYLLSMHIANTDDGFVLQGEEYHIPFYLSFTGNYFDNFVKATPKAPGSPYKLAMKYTNVSGVWGEQARTDLRRKFQTIRPKAGEQKQNLDIFEQNKKGGQYVFRTDEEVINLVADMKSVIESVN